MLVKAQQELSLQMYELEKETNNLDRLLNHIEMEVKHGLSKEITKNVIVKEVTDRYVEKPYEIEIPIEEARYREGRLVFESELIVINDEEKEELQRLFNLMRGTKLTSVQYNILRDIRTIIINGK